MANIYLLPQLRLEETTREQENKNKKKNIVIYISGQCSNSRISPKKKDLSGHDTTLLILANFQYQKQIRNYSEKYSSFYFFYEE